MDLAYDAQYAAFREEVRAFAEAHGSNVKIVANVEPGIKVAASEEALETAIENLVDNKPKNPFFNRGAKLYTNLFKVLLIKRDKL